MHAVVSVSVCVCVCAERQNEREEGRKRVCERERECVHFSLFSHLFSLLLFIPSQVSLLHVLSHLRLSQRAENAKREKGEGEKEEDGCQAGKEGMKKKKGAKEKGERKMAISPAWRRQIC